jgi:hypothetical protein
MARQIWTTASRLLSLSPCSGPGLRNQSRIDGEGLEDGRETDCIGCVVTDGADEGKPVVKTSLIEDHLHQCHIGVGSGLRETPQQIRAGLLQDLYGSTFPNFTIALEQVAFCEIQLQLR